MTISSETRGAGPYVGNDTATAFPFAFKVFSASDVQVISTDSDGAETTLTLTTDYTVTLNSNQDSNPGGTVTLPAVLATGDKLTITSDIAPLQATDLTNQGGFYPKVITNALDKLTILIQQILNGLGRSIKLPISNSDDGTLPAGDRANTVIGFDALGKLKLLAVQAGTSLVNLAASTGASLVGWIQSGVGAVVRLVEDKLRERVSALDFMTQAQIADVRARTALIDVTAAIQAAIDSRSTPLRVHLPTGRYKVTGTIYLRRNGVRLFGDGPAATEIQYVNAAGGIVFSGDTNTYNSTAQYEGCALEDFEVISSGSAATDASIVVDLSAFSYSHFNIEAQTRRAYGIIYYGQGNAGVAPYFNHIESTGLFGGIDYTQKAFSFEGGAFAGGSNGPNANIIGPITRMASLDIGVNLKVGQGNLFHNIIAESLGGTFFILGGNGAVATGTSSGSNNAFALKDTTKSWTTNQFVNGAVQITGGAGAGQIRRIGTNSATQLNVTEPWARIPDATSQYSVFELRSADNKFINVRQEGASSLAPDFIYAFPDSANTEVSQTSVQSLGAGKYLIDNSCSPKNAFYGHQKTLITHRFVNPGPSANIDAFERLSVWGGFKLAGEYVIDWVKVECSYYSHGDTANVTVDCGGSAVGGGSPTFPIIVPDGESQMAAIPYGARAQKSGTNEGIFLNLQTGAAFSATTDVNVTICITLLGG